MFSFLYSSELSEKYKCRVMRSNVVRLRAANIIFAIYYAFPVRQILLNGYEGGRPQTWDNIARWTEGILSWEKEFPWSEMEMDNEQRRLRELKKIAAVNLKKTSGGHTSNNGEIYRAAVDHHDIIKEQIDLYKADFIICCGTEYAFMDACYKDREIDWKMTSRGIWYFRDGKSVVISFSHPEARVKDAYLFYALTDAVKEIMRCEKFEEQL